MSGPKLFGVYTAQFPFLDAHETKIRPVIIIGKPHGQHNVVVVIPISSRSTIAKVDVALQHWSDEGLLKPSVARVHRLTTILQSDIIAELGQLAPDDKQSLRSALRQLMDL